jgi:5'-nucleotidase
LFHDEPTIKALNAMGLWASSVGNHEFDEGITELKRMQNGGCAPQDGTRCIGGPFSGADFQYLAANVRYLGTQRTIFPPYEIHGAGNGVKIAFIGLTLQGTPSIVTPSGVAGLEFDPEVQTVNRLADRLHHHGVDAVFVLVHQGGQQNPPYAAGYQDINGCENLSGDIVPIVQGLNRYVDVVASAHTHQAYNCRINGKLVTSAASFGRLVTEFDLTVSRAGRDIVAATAVNHIVTRNVVPDPKVQAIVDKYRALAAPIQNRVVGSAAAAMTGAGNAAGESSLGDVIADSQLDATSAADFGGAKVAFMNPGGIRADLAAGPVTYGALYAIQPFANTLVVKTMTGDMVKRLLEQQFDNPTAGALRVLQVSRGFSYSYDASKPAGRRIDPASIKLDGVTIAPGDSIRVTMNNFLASGGDGFTVFNEGTDQLGGDVDIDAFANYFLRNSPVAPGPQDRITRLG